MLFRSKKAYVDFLFNLEKEKQRNRQRDNKQEKKKNKDKDKEKEKDAELDKSDADLRREIADKIEVSLALDVPTRWSSIVPMLTSALKYKPAFIKLSEEGPFAEGDYFELPTEEQWTAVEALKKALLPIDFLSKNLCKENMNILKADAAFQSAFQVLSSYSSPIATKFLTALRTRYEARRNKEVLSILTFLLRPLEYSNKIVTQDLMEVSSLRVEITKQYNRLFVDNMPEPEAESESESDSDSDAEEVVVDEPEPVLQMEVEEDDHTKEASEVKQMAALFQQGQDLVKKDVKDNNVILSNTIEDEINKAFETGEIKPKLEQMEKVFNALPASSIECERAFSAIGLFHTKICNKLNDTYLDMLSFAKHYLKNDREKELRKRNK